VTRVMFFEFASERDAKTHAEGAFVKILAADDRLVVQAAGDVVLDTEVAHTDTGHTAVVVIGTAGCNGCAVAETRIRMKRQALARANNGCWPDADTRNWILRSAALDFCSGHDSAIRLEAANVRFDAS
jgi:hypothetical protein